MERVRERRERREEREERESYEIATRGGRDRELERERDRERGVHVLGRILAVCRTGVLPARPWPIPSSSV